MGRLSKRQTLGVWMNGEFVGRWTVNSRGEHEFVYDVDWQASPLGRSISLSLPLAEKQAKGARVKNYFDNLLPDNKEIRARIQQRFSLGSTTPIDLLSAIGRDCVGSLQLLPDGDVPQNVRTIEADPVGEAEIEQWLIRTPVNGRHQDEDDFRISIAGAQEKTAFLLHDGQWMRPRGSTPTTHIFKLPIGHHEDQGIDLTASVENEWLCAQILKAYGLPVANCWPAAFGSRMVLVVERFDRRLSSDQRWIMRLPQEDMCQARGLAPDQKYEREGGPGIQTIMNDVLLGSSTAESDRQEFFKTQVIFWLLAAIDGHAKNFSLFLEPRGGYRLTPRYDVLSAYPVLGNGPRLLQAKKIKMAMALDGSNRHYRWCELQRRHLESTAKRCGMEEAGRAIIDSVIAMTPDVVAKVSRELPSGFPSRVADSILVGLAMTADRLANVSAAAG